MRGRRALGVVWRSRARLYPILDRPGGRALLGWAATRLARRETTDDVAIVHRGAWFSRIGTHYLDGAKRFTFRHGDRIRAAYDWQFEAARDVWFHAYEPKPGDVVVDVGAGIGSETFVLSRAVGPEGRVLAIEAHPDTFRILEAQCLANRLANVALCECAVTDEPRPVYIEDREFHERNAISVEWDASRRREAVEGLPLDEICRRFAVDRIDFLKMNIEGAERLAVDGMAEIVERTEHVCIACHDFLDFGTEFNTRDRVSAFLREHGFTVHTRDDDPREFVRDHVHGRRDAR